jgi:hypothetical protein
MTRPVAASCLAAVLIFAAGAAAAIEPEKREAIVLHNRVYDGFGFVENFVPSSTDEFIVLADSDNAILYVATLEYFWPLSREVYASFGTKREVLEGTVAISQAGRPVAALAADVYAIVYPEGTNRGGARMVWGADAEAAYGNFREAMSAYNRAFARAQEDRSRYLRELREAAAARVRGEPTRMVAPALPEPEPVRLTVTEPRPGYRLSLPPGAYELALTKEGAIVAGTEKRLRVLPLAATPTVTADVIPEERWTRILASNGPEDRIFVGAGDTFYIALNDSSRFDADAYARLVNPQAAAVAGRATFLRREPHDAGLIEIRWDDGAPSTIARAGHKVEQIEGRDFGYVIRPATAGETPDLTAFAVTVPADAHGARLSLPERPGWSREIVVVRANQPALIWGLALLPAAFGLGLAGLRRIRHRRAAIS